MKSSIILCELKKKKNQHSKQVCRNNNAFTQERSVKVFKLITSCWHFSVKKITVISVKVVFEGRLQYESTA